MRLPILLLAALLLVSEAAAQDEHVMRSVEAARDVRLTVDPGSDFWRPATPVDAESDPHGHKVPEYRTEVRSRWTPRNLYFLFICPYQNLYLKPHPDTARETYELWKWNVAEVFLGSDFRDIKRYKEFEVSPHNEWVDLDINLHNPHHEEGWLWNSGFEHVTRIDQEKHVWYAAMRIPLKAVDTRTPAPGLTFRINLYRTEGPPGASTEITWQPVMSNTFHVPERFGILRLVAH